MSTRSEEQGRAVLLDGSVETRMGRWLKALTPQSIMRLLPTASVVGVPLAFIVARSYEYGKATYYGIPKDFVRVGPADAIAPFLSIVAILFLLFIGAHEVERVGAAKVANLIGGILRLIVAGILGVALLSQFGGWVRQHGLWVALITLAWEAVVFYVILWWGLPGIAWTLHQLGRIIHKARSTPTIPGKISRHIFRDMLTYQGSRDLANFVLVVLFCLALIGALPNTLGWLEAQGREEYPVITAANGSDRQVILAVYGDKTFTAELAGQHLRTVRMRQTVDLKDMRVTVERLGPLRSAHGFLFNYWSGW